uniref:Uncharacterized protein n=1 Tax=Globodera rostochiensis TaxID=31243 RepID=A0A914H0J2_GLORO
MTTKLRPARAVLLLLLFCFLTLLIAAKDDGVGNGSDGTIRMQPMSTSGEEVKMEATEAEFVEGKKEVPRVRRKEASVEEEEGGGGEDDEYRGEEGGGDSNGREATEEEEAEEKEEKSRRKGVKGKAMEEGKKKTEEKGEREGRKRNRAEEEEDDRQWQSSEENGTGGRRRRKRRPTENTEEQQPAEALDTAPPDVAIPQLSSEEDGRTQISDEFLRKLSAQQVADERARLHRGGNLRRPVDFEEALKMTVPYQKKKLL